MFSKKKQKKFKKEIYFLGGNNGNVGTSLKINDLRLGTGWEQGGNRMAGLVGTISGWAKMVLLFLVLLSQVLRYLEV